MKTTSGGRLREVVISLAKLAGAAEGTVENSVAAISQAFHHKPASPQHEDTRFEESDVDAKTVFFTAAGVLCFAWFAAACLYLVFSYFVHERARVSPPPLPVDRTSAAQPPKPRLQESPPRDLKAMRAREDWELNNYHWLDQKNGYLAIPIDVAVALVAARGVPPQKLAPNPTSTPPQEGTRLTGFEGKVEPEPR